MGERLIVSGGDGLREMGENGRRVPLAGAGALCAGHGAVFVACGGENAIWRLDAGRLMPTALMAGGPGMNALRLSADGERLYALCADADSLLMLDARRGEPLLLNRVGVNPGAMCLSPDERRIAVAGGGCGKVVLLCARTLRVEAALDAPGVVLCAALGKRAAYALSVNEALETTCTTFLPGGARRMLALPGMPGALLAREGHVLAATQGWLFSIAADGVRVLAAQEAPGRASRILQTAAGVALLDALGECLYIGKGRGRWEAVCAPACGCDVWGDEEENAADA